ncbi:hypothetical protein GCM10022240_09060 [Microbacterium kribbense]|uniref:GmrSD restriction endonucleases C-terminal domain-containing protein n=2 Tax=Microbacterium kribbense TaxID=433645 RepID=A0ABP7GC58_9MICO
MFRSLVSVFAVGVVVMSALGVAPAPAFESSDLGTAAVGSAVRSAATPASLATTAADWDRDGIGDVIGSDTGGRLWLYPGNGTGRFKPRVQLGTGWSGYDQIRPSGDFDGDGITDLIARGVGSHELWLYPGDGSGKFKPRVRIGTGWGGFTQIFSPGDWDGDGANDILALRKSDGKLILYSGTNTGKVHSGRQVGTGWSQVTSLIPTGDFDADGQVDFIGRYSSGLLRLYRANGSGGFTTTQYIGTGFGGFTSTIGVGDFSGDGYPDVLGRNSRGDLFMYRGNGWRGHPWIAPYPKIGTSWNSITMSDQTVSAPAPQPSGTMTGRQLLNSLKVGSESNSGYNRDYFKHWIDANHDCQDTRAEVLIAKSRTRVTFSTSSNGCVVKTGNWLSPFDNRTWTAASDVDIDHMVPLAEAWGSGARYWTAAKRQAYANDLGYTYSLQPMTDNLNQSKGAQDPAQWMPPVAKCSYAIQWVAIKYRWALTIDTAERTALSGLLDGSCGQASIKTPPRA